MKPLPIAALVLLAGNAMLWSEEWLATRRPELDLAACEAQLRGLLAGRTVESLRFEPNDLLPDDYLYVQASEGGPFVSIYVGYYPRQGLLAKEPHDPLVCYQAMGWSITERRPAPPTDSVHEIVVEQQGERRRAFYWQQSGPSGSEQTGIARLVPSRSDLVWVRIEVGEGYEARELGTSLVPAVRAVVTNLLP